MIFSIKFHRNTKWKYLFHRNKKLPFNICKKKKRKKRKALSEDQNLH